MVRVFDLAEAQYYCGRFQHLGGDALRPIRVLANTYRERRVTNLNEGTPEFDNYRDSSLRDVERRLFLAISHYRRSLDLMYTSSAAWAHVTLYYASFFAASALLGMFGCYANEKNFIVEVATGSPGSQGLELNTKAMSQLGLLNKGPHEKFWNIFYKCSSLIYPWVTDPALRPVLDPSSIGVTWQIVTRNRVNYDTHDSVALMAQFERSFDASRFPACLQDDLRTQIAIVDSMTRIAFSFAKQFNLSTDALGALTSRGASRGSKIRELILNQTLQDVSSKVTWNHFI